MLRQLIRWIFGQRIATAKLSEEKLNIFWGMPILSSDAISSVAYAVEEILLVLVPVIGAASFLWMPRLAVVIIILMLILTFSYSHVVDAYPNGGGAYKVAKENLSPLAGLVAGASISVDYTLTVAVSVCAASAAITSAVPALFPHRVALTVGIIILLVIANVRGIRESSRIFSFPTYAFIFSIIALVGTGMIKHYSGNAADIPHQVLPELSLGTQAVTLFLLLRAFSSGCSAVTGIEAVSDAVPNFREPRVHNAKIVYAILALSITVCFGGIAYLANLYHILPDPRQTVIAQISIDVFGQGTIFYLPFREVVGPLKEYIDSEEHASQPGDIITVLLPQFFVPKWWQMALHNNTSLFIANALFSKRNVVVSILPFYLEDLDRYHAKITAATRTED